MNIEKATRIFKALSDPQRLKLFLMVVSDCCGPTKGVDRAFTKACGCMGLTKSTVSHHFKALRRAGLLKAERHGRAFTVSVDRATMRELRDWLA